MNLCTLQVNSTHEHRPGFKCYCFEISSYKTNFTKTQVGHNTPSELASQLITIIPQTIQGYELKWDNAGPGHSFQLSRDITKKEINTVEMPFTCDYCDYKAKYRSICQIHVRTHTGERPFQCDKCDYSAKQKINLKRHKRTHTAELPHKCDICDYAAQRKCSLKVH